MTEVEEIIVELLEELDTMTPKVIEELRNEWMEQLKADSTGRYQRVEVLINELCDVAIDRARKRLEVV